MSEMIERIAKTIFLEIMKNNRELDWNVERLESLQQQIIRRVRDVIEAMREPTEAMIEAGIAMSVAGIVVSRSWHGGVAEMWRKMIDAALADIPAHGEGEGV
jgi:hypothetical protein